MPNISTSILVLQGGKTFIAMKHIVSYNLISEKDSESKKAEIEIKTITNDIYYMYFDVYAQAESKAYEIVECINKINSVKSED